MADHDPQKMVIARLDESLMEDEPGNSLSFQTLISRHEHGDAISVTLVTIGGRHQRVRSSRATRVYLLLSGSMTIQAGNDPPQTMAPHDLALVPCGTFYSLEGTGTYLVFNAPAFAEGDDEYESAPD